LFRLFGFLASIRWPSDTPRIILLLGVGYPVERGLVGFVIDRFCACAGIAIKASNPTAIIKIFIACLLPSRFRTYLAAGSRQIPDRSSAQNSHLRRRFQQ
jgi:hypothetical protein